jgi:hypothetical protein
MGGGVTRPLRLSQRGAASGSGMEPRRHRWDNSAAMRRQFSLESGSQLRIYRDGGRSGTLRCAKNHGSNVCATGKRRGAPFHVGRSVPLRRARITDRTSVLRGNGAEHRSTWGGACRSGVQESRTERPRYGETARSTVLRGAERAAPACKNRGPNVRVTGKTARSTVLRGAERAAPACKNRGPNVRVTGKTGRSTVLRGGRSVPLRRARIADRTSVLRGKRGGAPFYVVVGACRSGVCLGVRSRFEALTHSVLLRHGKTLPMGDRW